MAKTQAAGNRDASASATAPDPQPTSATRRGAGLVFGNRASAASTRVSVSGRGNERLGADRESQAEELHLAHEVLERPPGRPLGDQGVERIPDRGRERVPGPRDQLGGGPLGGGPQQPAGVELRRRYAGGGEPLRTLAERGLDGRFAQRLSAFSRSDCSRAWSGSISGSSSPPRMFGRECSVSAIRWSVIRFSLKL